MPKKQKEVAPTKVVREPVQPYDEAGLLWSEVGAAPIQVIPFAPPRFDVGDVKALEYLDAQGYVVFKNVATAEEIAKAEDVFWESGKMKPGHASLQPGQGLSQMIQQGTQPSCGTFEVYLKSKKLLPLYGMMTIY